ncbi:MAG: helix-turn-helix transcriptional regulator [Myxococcota bacterium]
MTHADGGQAEGPGDEPDASGIHISREPTSEVGWREILSVDGRALEPPVEALLTAYLRLKRSHRALVRSAEALAVALERVPLGLVVLVGRRVTVANREAYRLIDGSGLHRTIEDELEARDPAIQRQLEDAFFAIESRKRERVVMNVPQTKGALQVVLTLAGPDLPDGIVMALADPHTMPATDPESYRELYGLTPTECRVVVQLVMGRSSREIARDLGVGVETTRTHVKHILHKMGCHRQVDVVRRLVTGPTSLR